MSQQKRAVQTEDFTRLQVYSDPQLLQNEHAFLFVSTTINEDKNYEAHIHHYDLDKKQSKQWSFGKSKNNNPRVSPDGTQIVFQSNRSGTTQLWLLQVDGGEAKQLTTFKNGATNPHWTPDGKGIIFTARLEENEDVHHQKELSKEERKKEQDEKNKEPLVVSKLKYKADGVGFLDNKRSQIMLYHLTDGSIEQLTTGDADHHFQDISPNGETILFAGNLNKDADYELITDLFTLDITSKSITKLTDGNGSYFQASFSPDGKRVACFGHNYEFAGATQNKLLTIDVASKIQSELSTGWDFELGDAMIGDTRLGSSEVGPVWSKCGKNIYFIATDHGATGLHKVTLEGEIQVLYQDHNHVFGFSCANDGTFILGISSPIDPGNFYALHQDGELKKLTNANTDYLDEVTLSVPEELTITAEDGWEIQGWIMRPYGFETGKKYPFVLEIHGGPHAMYGQTYFHEMQLLAASGYVVLYTNPRGSHGYGQKFVDACRSDYGGKDYTDLMTAVDYALNNYDFIDETRLGVTGGSYGGFMTNWVVGHTNRFKAAVTQRCISNWLSFYGVSDIGYFFTKWELGHNLLEDPKQLWDFSPLKYAENVETPLLILHGELDYRCPIEQGEQFYVALKHLKKDVEFVRFPGADHNLSRTGDPVMRIERLNHIVRWFAQYLDA